MKAIPATLLRFLLKYKSHILVAVGMVAGEKAAARVGDWISSFGDSNPPPAPELPGIEINTPLPLTAFKEILKELLPATTAATPASTSGGWFNLENGIDNGEPALSVVHSS